MSLLRVVPAGSPEAGSGDVSLDQDAFTLGRDPTCSLPLADPGASRFHARLSHTPRGWLLEDLGSSNGTCIQGVLVQSQVLRHGDQIQIGGTRLVFLDEAPPPILKPPRRKGWLLVSGLGCLVSLLLLATLGAWFWSTQREQPGRLALLAAAEFRQAASLDAPAAFRGVAGPGLQNRVREVDPCLWPTVDADLGWARFFATSLVAAGKPQAGYRPVLFYHPWADVGLVTVWTPQGRLLDLQLIAGECLRRAGKAPFGGRRGWLHQQAYGPTAVAGLTAQTLRAFEQLMEEGAWRSGLEGVCEAFHPGQAQTASRMACGLQFAETIQELMAFMQPAGNPVRMGFARVVSEGSASVERAPLTSKATAILLKSLKLHDWAKLRPMSCTDVGAKVLVMAQHEEQPDLFLAAVFRKTGAGCELERLDAYSFQAWYGALK